MDPSLQRVAPIFPVRDVEAALEHYRRLGFAVRPYAEGDAAPLVYGFLSWGPVDIHLSRFEDLEPERNTSGCYLYVDGVDALYERWLAACVGGRLHPPKDTPWGLRELAHVDPDGNLLRVGSPLIAPAHGPHSRGRPGR